jgi:multidrug efflux pump subunit AcrA (membrane-fusion protein)
VKVVVSATVLVALAVGATLGALALGSSSVPKYLEAPATDGTVAQTTTLIGTIEPVTQADLNFAAAGTVASVPVKVGEMVMAGEVLATLATADLSSQVDQSQATLDNAESSLATAESPASSVTASAQQAVSSDRTSLANDGATMSDDATTDELGLTSAQGAVSSAQDVAASAAAQFSNDQSTLEAAQAKEEIDCAGDGITTAACSSDETTASSDQKQLNQDQTSTSEDETAVQSVETSLTETQLKNAQTSREDEQKVVADKTQLKKDLTALSDAEDGLYADQVGADQMAVDSAKNGLAAAEQNLADASLVSPIRGLVTAVNVEAGDSAQAASSTDGSTSNSSGATSPAIEVESPSTFDVDATASTSQVSELKVGDQVLIVPTGATAPSIGTVVSISTIPTISSGVATFPIVIGVTGKPTDMYVGATANLTVTVLDVKNVLTVPTSAVQTFGRSSFVNVLEKGKEVKRPVVTGAVGGALTQIKSGLTAGEKVVVGNLGESLPGSNSSNKGQGQHLQFGGIVSKTVAP